MDDLISRSALIEEVCTYKETGCGSCKFQACCPEVINIINEFPTIEAKPVVYGEWIKTFRYMRKNINTGKLEPVYSCDCPICKYHTGNQGVRFNFCPNCGADMRGGKNE